MATLIDESVSLHTTPYYYYPLVSQPTFPERGSKHATILGNPAEAGRLFIRPCFTALTELIMQLRQRWLDKRKQKEGWDRKPGSARRGVIIAGTSGVGKSVFAAHLIKHIRSTQPTITVVYQSLTDNISYLIAPHPNGAPFVSCARSRAPPMKVMEANEWIYIVDAGVTARGEMYQAAAFTIVIASPQAKAGNVVHWWNKQSLYPQVLYMPRWSEEELETCSRLVHPGADDDASVRLPGLRGDPVSFEYVKRCVHRYGRVSRPVFAQESERANMENDLNQALANCDLEHVARLGVGSATNTDRHGAASSWLLHYEVDEKTFDLDQIVFASVEILEEVYKRAEASDRYKLSSLHQLDWRQSEVERTARRTVRDVRA